MSGGGRNGERHSRFGSWWLAGIGSREGGVAPASLPLFRIWDITHPVGMVKNPACVPSGRRFAHGIPDLKAVRMVVRFVPYQQE